MKRIFLDTNIILDLLIREEYKSQINSQPRAPLATDHVNHNRHPAIKSMDNSYYPLPFRNLALFHYELDWEEFHIYRLYAAKCGI